jgi:penicillin-binding protein 1A
VTTLLRLTTGYAEFVNGGRKLEATLIDRVQDRHGKTVYRFDKRTCSDCNQADWRGQDEPLLDENQQQVLDPRTAYQIVSILEGVIQRGTGVAIRVLGRPLAGKTGTSSDFRDAWFVGFSPDLAVGVFVGKDSFQTLGQGEQGALAAAPIFRDFMKEALAGEPPTPFRIPQGIALVPTNPFTGAVVQQGSPGAILEAFKAGTEPGAGYMVSDIEDPGVAMPTAAAASDAPQGATPTAASGLPPAPTTIGTGTGGLY